MNNSNIERARAWLRNTPGAISGQGGHNATFAVATALVHASRRGMHMNWPTR